MTSRILASAAAYSLLVGALTACSSGSGISLGEPTTAASASSPAPVAATSAESTGTSTSSPASNTIDSVQLRLSSSDEVSPGVLQSQYGISADIEWMGVQGGNAYDGEKCAAVITLLDPAGQIVTTDRQSTCSGSTSFGVRATKNGTGTYTVTATLAPWANPDTPAESRLEFTVIAAGT